MSHGADTQACFPGARFGKEMLRRFWNGNKKKGEKRKKGELCNAQILQSPENQASSACGAVVCFQASISGGGRPNAHRHALAASDALGV